MIKKTKKNKTKKMREKNTQKYKRKIALFIPHWYLISSLVYLWLITQAAITV